MKTKELKVSAQTMNFIECMNSLTNQWGLVYKALENYVGERQACEIMEKQYGEAHDRMKDVLSGFLLDSIDSNISSINYTEI